MTMALIYPTLKAPVLLVMWAAVVFADWPARLAFAAVVVVNIAYYVILREVGGFRAPLDWYRCIDLNWSLTAFLQDAPGIIKVDGLHAGTGGRYLVGEHQAQVSGVSVQFLGHGGQDKAVRVVALPPRAP